MRGNAKDKEQRKSRAGLDNDKIAQMYKSGKSCDEIAELNNVTSEAIKYRLNKLGLYKGRRGYLKSILLKISKLENDIKANELTDSDKSTIRNRLYDLIVKL